ncbi:MAG TPA: Gfo/Idh/MocA family oxidoreductase [Candidatus Binatia bacterium]|jgi:predicted dehydrogenase|nr:Gfo/Idh/MocA family oxidoreductase [Candidatus Binatia bacterium]
MPSTADHVSPDPPLRIGVLGAARITPMALLHPARRVGDAVVTAVAARDGDRARRFAERHHIPTVYDSYGALLADPTIEAVYNPLPNSLHAVWTIRALEAGKHVLCEKPFAANVAEARSMAQAAEDADRVLMEAFHYRYHPLFARMRAILTSGELGQIRHLEAHFCIPLWRRSDIRYRADLAGGGLMDTGCYTVHLLRHLAAAEPEVVGAQARWTRGGVDRWLSAELRFPGGRTARLTCALLSASVLRMTASVRGSSGSLHVINPIAPQFFHRLRIRSAAGSRTERVAGPASYDGQLRAFVAAVRRGEAFPTGPTDAIANMQAIEAIYAAAGRPAAQR